MAEKKQEIQKIADERSVEFIPFGATDKIRLTAAMVRQFIAVPTRSGALPSERDCVRFIMLCRGKRANPFEGDCWLIGYDTQSGPSFSLVCGVDLFQKRAEVQENYDGCDSGIIVQIGDQIGNVVKERPGSFYDAEHEKLLGGWSKVYRKDRSHPEYTTVKLSVYDTGMSRWKKDPAGMIEKVARSQGLRKAFPTALGGLYTDMEMEKVTQAGEGLMDVREPIEMPKLVESRVSPTQAKEETVAEAPEDYEMLPPREYPEPPSADGFENVRTLFMRAVSEATTAKSLTEILSKALEQKAELGKAWWMDFETAIADKETELRTIRRKENR